MIDRTSYRPGVIELCEAPSEHTPAEVTLLSQLLCQKVRTVMIPMCRGDKVVQEAHALRNIYKPASWEDINLHFQQQAMAEFVDVWNHRFAHGQRGRPYQHIVEVSFPARTRYRCSLVADIYPDRISIISPFKVDFSIPVSPAPSQSSPY